MNLRFTIAVLLIVSITFSGSTSGIAVEGGEVNALDENALSLDPGATAFLYSPRIAFTAAHGHEQWGSGTLSVTTSTGRRVKVSQLLVAKDFQDRQISREDIEQKRAVGSRSNDFAILILAENIEMQKPVRILQPSEVNLLISNEREVNLVGYGFFDSSRVKSLVPRKLKGRLIGNNDAKRIFDSYYESGHPSWAPPNARYELTEINVVVSQAGGSTCDNDSGSGWYLQDAEGKAYIGPMGAHTVGTPNCGGPGFWGEFGNVGAIEPAYRHLSLIQEAEAIVREIMARESLETSKVSKMEYPKATKSPNALKSSNKKFSVLCIKKEKTKRISGAKPKCPAGWKKA